jgi:hypothetical protein
MTASAGEDIVTIAVAVPATASEDVAKTVISIRPSSIPTSIARVMAVNKLLALLIQATTSTTSLGHRVGRHADEYHETQNQNSK